MWKRVWRGPAHDGIHSELPEELVCGCTALNPLFKAAYSAAARIDYPGQALSGPDAPATPADAPQNVHRKTVQSVSTDETASSRA